MNTELIYMATDFKSSLNMHLVLTPSLLQALAPLGHLRASINLGNPILAHRDANSGEVGGVSVDLARALAQCLGLNLELVVFDTAGKSVQAVTAEQADIGFFAVDPQRSQGISFTAPYVLIEGSYLVRAESALQDNAEVDRPGTRVVVGNGSAYDLFLTRELQHATIVRAATSPSVVAEFISKGLEVAAGVKQQLEMDQKHHTGLRLLPGRFMVIQQAMGLPMGRGDEAIAFLRAFVETAKASGFVAEALTRHGLQGASVAPAA
jgi:polar amino acid transport system substrate-binding protein